MDIREWITQVCLMPYFERRVFLSKNPEPPQSRYIYKYRDIDTNSSTSLKRVQDILVNNLLWLSKPSSFNDPFDMQARIIVEGKGKEIRDRYKEIQKRQGVRYKERKKQLSKVMKRSRHEMEEELTRSYKEYIDSMGVCSFAGDPRSILMWSHYAKNHEGLCIQFERARDYSTLCRAIPVDYNQDYPKVDWLNNFRPDLSKALLRKHDKWSYEDEYRIIEPNNADTHIHLKPEAIVGLIFGCACSEDTKSAVFDFLNERKSKGHPCIKVYTAQLHPYNYKLMLCG